MDWQERYAARRRTLVEAIALIPPGTHLFIGSGAAEPVVLVEELVRQANRFADNTIVHLLTLGPAPYVDARYRGHFRHNAFFIGANVREAVHEGRADYTPVFLSQIPSHIRSRRMPVDVALVQVSPPDRFGFVNLGVSVDVVLAAVETARMVIAEVNPRMPVVHGTGFLRMDDIDAWVLAEHPLPEQPSEALDEVALEIGRHVAALVEDGSTLQMGIGQIPDATLKALTDRTDLGIWTEMFSDGVLDLIENGNVTNRFKPIHRHKVTSSFTFGSQRLYDYVDRNPLFTFHPSDYTNDPIRIARQHKMVAINSALQVDLTGQVCADSIGHKFYSGIGGQVDFIRGAAMCPGGKPIIAIRATAKGGSLSRIVPVLDEGAGVVTSRGDVRFVVTEYGVADLQGKSIRERALALIQVAHPNFRTELLTAAKARRYVFPDQIIPRAPASPVRETVLETPRGSLLIRALSVTDEQKLSDFFYSLSRETIYQRWMRMLSRMPHHRFQGYFETEDAGRAALVAEVLMAGQEPEIVATASYTTDRRTNFADVAFVVRDDWQRQGIGTALLQALVEIARERGVSGFTAEVLRENQAMLHVFHKSGLPIRSTLTDDVYVLEISLALGARRSLTT